MAGRIRHPQDPTRGSGGIGAGQTAGSLLSGPGQPSTLATNLDRMIEGRTIEPMIVVTPHLLPDDNASLDPHCAGELDRINPSSGSV